MTMISIIIKHAARLPALRWYSEAALSSSAAPDVSTAIDDIFDSMLSRCQSQNEAMKGDKGDLPNMPPC